MTTEGFWYSFCFFHRFVFQPTKWHTKTCYNTFIAFNSIRFMSLNFESMFFDGVFLHHCWLLQMVMLWFGWRRNAKELHQKWPKTYEHTDWLAYLNSANFFLSYFYIKWHETLEQSFGTWKNTKHTNFFHVLVLLFLTSPTARCFVSRKI